jgi:hypothetical protein
MFSRPQNMFRAIPGAAFGGAIHQVTVGGPEPHHIPIRQGPEEPPAIEVPKLGSDIMAFVADLPCKSEEQIERRSVLAGRLFELIEEIRSFALSLGQARQGELLAEIEEVSRLGRQAEEKFIALRNERGAMNDPLRLSGERLQHARVGYESAMAGNTQSAFPTEEEKSQLRRDAESARKRYVEAEAEWHRRDAEARKLDAEITKAQSEYGSLKERATKLNCALSGTPYADRSGLVAVPEV